MDSGNRSNSTFFPIFRCWDSHGTAHHKNGISETDEEESYGASVLASVQLVFYLDWPARLATLSTAQL
ncbi:MAG: hypothetical protein ABIA92_01330 [Patescibacteria group bacterium]